MITHPGAKNEGVCSLRGVHPGDPGTRPEGGDVEARQVGVRALEAVAGDHGVHQARIVPAQGRFVETGALQGGGTDIGQEHIRRGGQPGEGVPAFRSRDVQDDGALAAVIDGEGGISGDSILGVGEDMAHRIAFRTFNLDDVCAPVAQDSRGARCGNVGGKFDNLQTLE